MVTITLYAKQKKRHRCIEQTFGLCGRRRGWDVSREQHQNMYIIEGETDHQPRLDAWDKHIILYNLCFSTFILRIYSSNPTNFIQSLQYASKVSFVVILFIQIRFCLFVYFNKIDHSIFSKSLHINLYNIKVVIPLF